MAFRMVCPKCGSTTFSIERDNRTFAHTAQQFEMIFSCRCGKQLFGDQIEREYMDQKRRWEESRDDRAAAAQSRDQKAEEAAQRKEHLERAMAYRARYLEEKRKREAEEDERRREEEHRRWQERVAAARSEDDPVPAPSSEAPSATATASGPQDESVCAWDGCSNPRRPRSKYCSRQCSNKNARSRHKKRRRGNLEAA